MESPSRGCSAKSWVMKGDRSKEICVLHYLPVEEYPPLQNLMLAFCEQKEMNVVIFSGSLEANKCYSRLLADNITAFFFPYSKTGGWRSKCDFVSFIRKETVSRRFDCVFAFGDEFSGLVGSRMSAKVKALHLHELPPQSRIWNKYVSKSLLLELVLLKLVIKQFDWVSQVTPKRAELFSRRFKVQCRNLFNYPSASFASNIPERAVNDKLKIVYVGSCNPVSIQVSILSMLSKLYGVELSVLPTNSEGLDYIAGLDGVQILRRVPYSELPNLLGQFDVGLVLYNGHSDNMRYGVPNKLIEYLRCGLHVVYHSALESVTDFVRAHQLNSVVHILPNSTVHQVKFIENDLSKRVKSFGLAMHEFTFEQEYQELFEFLSSENADVNED